MGYRSPWGLPGIRDLALCIKKVADLRYDWQRLDQSRTIFPQEAFGARVMSVVPAE
jgi:hypothetical protein